MEQAADAEDPDYPGVTEETLKQQEMIHCKDGHCDIQEMKMERMAKCIRDMFKITRRRKNDKKSIKKASKRRPSK